MLWKKEFFIVISEVMSVYYLKALYDRSVLDDATLQFFTSSTNSIFFLNFKFISYWSIENILQCSCIFDFFE
uniref:Uncharacterized protein n=1 Tax=Ascaris lumbricoides TaxID=6252 RepID=A0A0M3HJ63_ASCLU